MRLADLSYGALRALGFIDLLICLAALFCAVRAFRCPKGKKIFACSLLAAALTFFLSSPIGVYFRALANGRAPVQGQRLLLALPVWTAVCVTAAALAATAVLILRLRQLLRRELTARSLCEGLDQLPDGVCYSLPDGYPRLVNDRMVKISNAAFGAGITNVPALERKLANGELRPGCRLETDDGNTFLLLPDGTAWRLQKQTVTLNGKPMTETIAFDATARYRALRALRERNDRMERANRQLRLQLEQADRAVREKEALEAKIRLHNRLGQCLLVIRSYLTGDGPARRTVSEQLKNTAAMLQNTEPDTASGDRLQAVLMAADAVGVEIRIRGAIPPAIKPLIEYALHECLTNTVKHAHGHTLTVEIEDRGGDILVALTNDGDPPAGPVEETGGLANLRAKVERQGGEMTVESSPAFRLQLRFGRGEAPTGAKENHIPGGTGI